MKHVVGHDPHHDGHEVHGESKATGEDEDPDKHDANDGDDKDDKETNHHDQDATGYG